jgi:hypothetical protein
MGPKSFGGGGYAVTITGLDSDTPLVRVLHSCCCYDLLQCSDVRRLTLAFSGNKGLAQFTFGRGTWRVGGGECVCVCVCVRVFLNSACNRSCM